MKTFLKSGNTTLNRKTVHSLVSSVAVQACSIRLNEEAIKNKEAIRTRATCKARLVLSTDIEHRCAPLNPIASASRTHSATLFSFKLLL